MEHVYQATIPAPLGVDGFFIQAVAYDKLGQKAESQTVMVGKIKDTVVPKLSILRPVDKDVITTAAAVDVVAERRNIDLVYRFVPTEREFEALTPDVAEKEVFLRAALRYPEDLDITNDILEELSLELE